MNSRYFHAVLLLALFIFGSVSGLYSIQDDSLPGETAVTLAVETDVTHVPLNRTVRFTIQVSWEGDMDLIKMGEVEEPPLTNFEIQGTSTANRVLAAGGRRKSIKEISYILSPKTLGMGYVESAGLSYEDLTTGKTHHLMTQRMGVEVVSPVEEPGQRSKLWLIIPAACLLGAGAIIFILMRKKAGHQPEEQPVRLIEENYLEELKSNVDLREGDRREGFAVLSRLFRKYLTDKFGVQALEATTGELIQMLKGQEFDESLVRRCEALLTKADVVKFSRQEASQADLDEAYTTVETVFESYLAKAREMQAAAAGEEKKGKRWGRKQK